MAGLCGGYQKWGAIRIALIIHIILIVRIFHCDSVCIDKALAEWQCRFVMVINVLLCGSEARPANNKERSVRVSLCVWKRERRYKKWNQQQNLIECLNGNCWQDNWANSRENYGFVWRGKSTKNVHNDGAFRLNDWLVAIIWTEQSDWTNAINFPYDFFFRRFCCSISPGSLLYYLNVIISSIEFSWHNTFILADPLISTHTFTLPRLIDHRAANKLYYKQFSTTNVNSQKKVFLAHKLIFFFSPFAQTIFSGFSHFKQRKQSLIEIYARKTFISTIPIHRC